MYIMAKRSGGGFEAVLPYILFGSLILLAVGLALKFAGV